MESPAVVRRRHVVVAVTLLVGTVILAGTLAVPAGSPFFYALGILAGATWIVGALLAGPIPTRRLGAASGRLAAAAPALLLGGLLFGAFLAAKLLAEHVPVVSGNVASVLATADAGPRVAVLAVALLNGVGEEMFFRGSLRAAFARHAGFWATALYCLVTVATLNVALVAAALVMGTVFSLERRATGGVFAPIVTHLSWSTLMILLLPR